MAFDAEEFRRGAEAGDMEDKLSSLRLRGWRVAVHNDYQLNGQFHTFWLFTHPSGRWIKGEGASDDEALLHACMDAERELESN